MPPKKQKNNNFDPGPKISQLNFWVYNLKKKKKLSYHYSNSEMMWKILKKNKLKCEMIWKIWKNLKSNSDKIWTIWKKIVK